MTCSANGGDPEPSLQWYRNGKYVTEQDNVSNSLDKSYSAELSYLLTSEDETAKFTCKAEGVAATVNQSCSITLEIPPTVTIITNLTTVAAEDSLEFKCKVMSPWNITTYIWKYDNQPIDLTSNTFKLNSDNTELTISNLQSEDAEKVVECTAMTSSGLNSSDSVIITIFNPNEQENSTLLIILVVAGAVVFILLVCIAIFILCQNRKQQKENRIKKENSTDYDIVFKTNDNMRGVGLPQNNLNITEDIGKTCGIVHERKTYSHEKHINDKNETEGTYFFETYGHSSDQDGNTTNEDDIDALYAQPVKPRKSDIQANVVGLPLDFRELYAKPMKETKGTVRNTNEEVADFGELYAKPNKGHVKHVNNEEVADVGELYAKPNKRDKGHVKNNNGEVPDFEDLYAKI